MNIFFMGILILLLVAQGGFYPMAYLIVGILSLLFFIISKRTIIITKEIIGIVIIALVYLVSVIANGLSYSSLSQGMLPLVCLTVAIVYISGTKEEKDNLISKIEILGIVSGFVAILIFLEIFNIAGAMNAGRLQFTFQYANIAGTWFAVSFVLARDSKNKIIKRMCPINFVALLMTKSIGAILIWFIMQSLWLIKKVIREKNKIGYGILTAHIMISIVAGIVVSTRYQQGIYTFIERIIQSYDGIRVLIKHILVGIGPGNWQYLYPFYQSAQYKAGVIHNSYVQMGVSAGIIPMILMIILLIISIIRYVKNGNCRMEAALLILLHSMIDYCLSFVFIDVLLIVLIGCDMDAENGICHIAQKTYTRLCMCIICGIMCLCIYGNVWIRNMDKYVNIGMSQKAEDIYAENYSLMRYGYKENQIYLRALLSEKNKVSYDKFVKCCRKSAMSRYYEILEYRTWGNLKMEQIIKFVVEQPFNYDLICELTKIVQDDNYSEAEIFEYEKVLNDINEKLKKYPANWLNNQKILSWK